MTSREASSPRKTVNTSDISETEPGLDILFFGSDHFSIPILDHILRSNHQSIPSASSSPVSSESRGSKPLWRRLEVVTSSDQNLGRGSKRKRVRPPLLEWAEAKGIKVHQIPEDGIKHWELPNGFSAPSVSTFPPPLSPSQSLDHATSPRRLLITASFGHILPSSVLNPFPDPASRLNVHPSLLPQYRGAAPIQWAILNGDTSTGVTVQSLALPRLTEDGKPKAGVDTGEIWAQVDGVEIKENDRYTTLMPRLAEVGGELLVDFLRRLTSFSRDQVSSTPQDPAKATRAPKIKSEKARVNFEQESAEYIERKHRAIGHQEPIFFSIGPEDGKPVQITSVGLYRFPLQIRRDENQDEDEETTKQMGSYDQQLRTRLLNLPVGGAMLEKYAQPLQMVEGWAGGQSGGGEDPGSKSNTESKSKSTSTSTHTAKASRLLVRCKSPPSHSERAAEIVAGGMAHAQEDQEESFLDIRLVKPWGKKEMPVAAWWDGLRKQKRSDGTVLLTGSS